MLPTAGTMDTPCELHSRQITGHSTGGHEQVDLVPAGTVWLQLGRASSSETDEHDAQPARTKRSAIAHYHPQITLGSRLEAYDGTIYEVDGDPIDPDGRRQRLQIDLVEVRP